MNELNEDEVGVGDGDLVIRGPKTLELIISQGVTDIQDEIMPVVTRVKDVSAGLLETTQYGELEEASSTIGVMSTEMQKLKPPSVWENLPFFGKTIEKKVLMRKSIKEVLEEALENYREVAGNLKTNIVKVTEIEEASIQYAGYLEGNIDRMSQEMTLLQDAVKDWDKGDVRGLNNIQNKLRAYQSSIDNATTFLSTQRNTIIQCGVQKQTREMLYATMTNLAPHVEILANQQLTMLTSGNEVSTAVRINNAAIESVRAATVMSAKMTRSNAEAVAKAAYSPIIDEKTLQDSKKELLVMIKNVNTIINKALVDGAKAAEVARKSEQEIEAAMSNVVLGNNSKGRRAVSLH